MLADHASLQAEASKLLGWTRPTLWQKHTKKLGHLGHWLLLFGLSPLPVIVEMKVYRDSLLKME